MTEHEIAEEQRRQAEALRAAKKALMSEASWESFFRYFQFAEVSWLAQCFFSYLEGRDFVSKDEAMLVTGEWLQHRWGHEARGLQVNEVRPELIPKALHAAEIAPDLESWELPHIVVFASHYQDLHLEAENNAGFAQADAQGFKEVFDHYDKNGAGIRARELWAILTDLGFDCGSVEDQKQLIDLLKNVNTDKSGSINFCGLLYLLRKLLEKEKLKERKREHSLITGSGMSLEECEEWLDVFQTCAGERASVDFGDMRRLFEQIGLKWDHEGSRQMLAWLKEVDEDSNGLIDFGEFCCLINKMWTSDFASIKRKSAEAMSTRSLTPRVVSAKERSAAAAVEELDPMSPTPSRRRQPRSSWVSYVSEIADHELEPTSPNSRRIISEFQMALSRQG